MAGVTHGAKRNHYVAPAHNDMYVYRLALRFSRSMDSTSTLLFFLSCDTS